MVLISLYLIMLLPISLGLTYLYRRDYSEVCDWLAAIQWFVLGASILTVIFASQNA